MTKSLGVTNKEVATKAWLKLKEDNEAGTSGYGSPAKAKTARQQPISEFLTTYLYEKEKEWKKSRQRERGRENTNKSVYYYGKIVAKITI